MTAKGLTATSRESFPLSGGSAANKLLTIRSVSGRQADQLLVRAVRQERAVINVSILGYRQEGLRMVNRLFGGNGSSKGFTNAVTLGPGWVLFLASQSDPPPPDELPYALSQGLEQWLKSKPGVRVRTTLPILKDGNTIGIHVWFDGE